MLKRDVVEQLKSLLTYQEDSLKERERAAVLGNYFIDDIKETYKKDTEALKLAIKAVDAFDYDERDEITITVKAIKAPEGGAYYYELETGDRLVIREGQIEGIYTPEEKPNEWKTAFIELCDCTSCSHCPARTYCARCAYEDDNQCFETLKNFLIENKDE